MAVADRHAPDNRAVQRIAAIAALIQSDQAGEALAACRALVAALDRHGLRIADVILTALAPMPDGGDRWWQDRARDCLECEPWSGCWSPRTRDFLREISWWPREPSESQRRWLNECVVHVERWRAAS